MPTRNILKFDDTVSLEEKLYIPIRDLYEWAKTDPGNIKNFGQIKNSIENKFIFCGKSSVEDILIVKFENNKINDDFGDRIPNSEFDKLNLHFVFQHWTNLSDLENCHQISNLIWSPNHNTNKRCQLFGVKGESVLKFKEKTLNNQIYNKCMICGDYNPWMEPNSFCWTCKTDPRNQFKIENIQSKMLSANE